MFIIQIRKLCHFAKQSSRRYVENILIAKASSKYKSNHEEWLLLILTQLLSPIPDMTKLNSWYVVCLLVWFFWILVKFSLMPDLGKLSKRKIFYLSYKLLDWKHSSSFFHMPQPLHLSLCTYKFFSLGIFLKGSFMMLQSKMTGFKYCLSCTVLY